VLERVPMVNVHFSLLPRWRGAAPVERAILAGDTETGVCLMGLEEGLDTGPVYECVRVPIGPEETADELRDNLVAEGTELVVRRLADGPGSLGEPVVQEGEPTYAAKIDPEELHLDWSQPAEQVHRVIRIGRAWTTFRGKRLQILKARLAGSVAGDPGTVDGLLVACGDGGAVELVEVKPEGKGAQPAGAWRNGAHLEPGERLGE
jgi:methionyl-tRNA formyltransferase